MVMITLYAIRKRDTDVQNRLLDSVGEGEGGMFRENRTETSILSRVKQITSPGWMHETSTQGWCTGKTPRDGMEREAGGGIRMGNTCKKKKLLKSRKKKFMAAITICSDFGAQKNKLSHCFHCFPIYLP